MIRIKVPATTANLGTGFDSLGVAFELYNSFRIEKVVDDSTQVIWNCTKTIEDTDNLMLKVINDLLVMNHCSLGFRVWVDTCEIPMGKGLGSSAASIAAGCIAANYLLNDKYSIEELMHFALHYEPHPDNLAPAFMGGMILSSPSELPNEYIYSQINLQDDLHFYVFVPAFSQSTSASRGQLPTDITLEKHVKNSARACCLINAINQSQHHLLRHAMQDTIHQPSRLSLIPDADSIFMLSKSCGALGEFLSGSGPSLISVVHATQSEKFQKDIIKQIELLELDWIFFPLSINRSGAIIDSFSLQSTE